MQDLKVLTLTEWKTPVSQYEEETAGKCRIDKHLIKGFYNYNGIEGNTFVLAKNNLALTRLSEFRDGKWCTWMVDSPADYRAMQIYANRARGKVLTTGLGLGILVHELCKNDRVESVTVVELQQDVIDLISKHLPNDSRITIIQDDFWNFVADDNTAWDTIVVDLWVFTDTARQLEIYRNEIVPAVEILSQKYPDSNIVFHAFAGMPSEGEIAECERAGDNVGFLVYGLQEVEQSDQTRTRGAGWDRLVGARR